MTFRSPWSWFAALFQIVIGLLFLSIGAAPDASALMKMFFAALGLALLIGGVRSLMMRVKIIGSGKTLVVGYFRTQTMVGTSARPEIVDDKVFAAVWVPVVTDKAGNEQPLTQLAGYGWTRKPNRRVERVCLAINKLIAKR